MILLPTLPHCTSVLLCDKSAMNQKVKNCGYEGDNSPIIGDWSLRSSRTLRFFLRDVFIDRDDTLALNQAASSLTFPGRSVLRPLRSM